MGMRGLADLVQRPDPDSVLDRFEERIATLPPVPCPLKHYLLPDLYVREIVNPKGSILTTRIHRFQHVFVLAKGVVWVYNALFPRQPPEVLEAPHIGITPAGTRRLIYAVEDVVFITCHPNPPPGVTDLDELEAWFTVPRENPLLPEGRPKLLQENTVMVYPELPVGDPA